jgi:microsomal epoxide hydrolase
MPLRDMQPFEIRPEMIDDLCLRLTLTRWPDQLPDMPWALGSDIDYVREICEHWCDEFDFALLEQKINGHRNVIAEFDGIRVHAMLVDSPNPNATPLMLMHGWPGSVAEMFDVIEPLRAQHQLIIPSIPGYGFSGPTTKYGVGIFEIADTYVALMNSLGHEKFVIAGGDWGAIIAGQMCARHPKSIIGHHSTMLPVFPPAENMMDGVGEAEGKLVERASLFRLTGTGYQAIQSTKPQSLAYALTDSPAGLAGWILEKFKEWSYGDVREVFTKQRLLENISIYWFTGTINSSMRLYHEAMGRGVPIFPMGKIDVPTGHAQFPGEIYPTTRVWAERVFNIVHWNVMEKGGHFAAMEEPQAYATDLLQFTASLGA